MTPKTVLIVDDERRMADSLRNLLAATGYEVATAYNGAAGLELLKQRQFNVLVTDLRMQGIDGLEIIRTVHELYPRTLIIVITGHATTESAIEAVHYGVFDYLRKPFEFDLFRMAIEKAFQKIETDQLRDDTAAMITHDIKVPLTSIIGFASMIYDREQAKFHPRAAEFADTIKANGQKILELIENYLTTCRIDAGSLKIVPIIVDPRQLILDVVEITELESSRHHRRIVTELNELPALVYLDESLIYRAIGNLLQNAIKYSIGVEPIRVVARRIPETESPLGCDTLKISVVNDTNEIVPEEISEVFERYARGGMRHAGGHDGPTRIEGSGIGLYVVRAVAQAHGGRADAEFLSSNIVCFNLLFPLHVRAETTE